MHCLIQILLLIVNLEETVILIPGPRQVQGKILKIGNEYSVQVSMRPYRSFGEARNIEIGGVKLRIYALVMIAQLNGVQKLDFDEIYFEWIEKSENMISAKITAKVLDDPKKKNVAMIDEKKGKCSPKKIVIDKFKAGADMAETIGEIKKSIAREIYLARDEKDFEKMKKISGTIKKIKKTIIKDIEDDLLIFETETGDGTSKGELKRFLEKTIDFFQNELSKPN